MTLNWGLHNVEFSAVKIRLLTGLKKNYVDPVVIDADVQVVR